MMKEIESWMNGEFVPNSKLGISMWDAHYFFGHAVFDAFRTYDHTLHNFHYHIDRLYKSASLTGIPIKYTKGYIKNRVIDVMTHNEKFFDNDEYRFMVFVTPGKFKIFDDHGDTEPNITIQLTTMSRYAKFVYPYLNDGFLSVISEQRQIPSRFLDVRVKSCSRLHYGLADLECKNYPIPANPILLDEHGNICESSGANIAFTKGKTIYIPDGTDMLYGATMKDLETVSEKLGLKIVKGIFKPYDIIDSDCILYTSTYSGITPSYQLIYKKNKYNLNNNGIYSNIINGFSELVGIDVIDQWRKWYEKRN